LPGPDAIAGLIPHAGRMCLLERIIEWTPEYALLATGTHRARDNPLGRGGRLRAVNLCEYGAQAMAVHGGLIARAAGEAPMPGLLVSLRDVRLRVAFVEALSGDLVIEARRLHATKASWQYAFRVSHADAELVSGRAAVMMRGRSADGKQHRSRGRPG
jgi:predicted hotdog family 3-hydroxylacyl-ACP dehydratase